MKSVNLRLCISAILVSTCLGCRRDGAKDATSAADTLLLYCGAGIQLPAAELADTFARMHNIKIETDYAGSELLISRIKLNRRGDLYMPGDKYYIDLAAEEGLVVGGKTICYFVPTILVQKGNPMGIIGLRDLVKPGISLGLGDPRACAIGRKSRKIFAKNNIPWSEVEKNLRYQSLTVNELGGQIQTGSLDAVIIWDAVANYYADHAQMVTIPLEQNIISTVEMGILKFTQNRELAQKFVEFAASERGQAIFKKHNYRVEPPGN